MSDPKDSQRDVRFGHLMAECYSDDMADERSCLPVERVQRQRQGDHSTTLQDERELLAGYADDIDFD